MDALILVGFAIGLDNFIVGLSFGTLQLGTRRRRLLALLLGLFEGLMPLAGLWLGRALAQRLALPWLAPVLLVLTAVFILLGARQGASWARDSARAAWLLVLPALLSVDNLLAGGALGALGHAPLPTLLVVGALSAALAGLGLYLGHTGTRWLPVAARPLAAALLLVLAIADFS